MKKKNDWIKKGILIIVLLVCIARIFMGTGDT